VPRRARVRSDDSGGLTACTGATLAARPPPCGDSQPSLATPSSVFAAQLSALLNNAEDRPFLQPLASGSKVRKGGGLVRLSTGEREGGGGGDGAAN
jgi:hypothetical protein